MALRAVPDHPKFAEFKLALGQPKGAALGWLESVWHFCGKFTPQGNLGKYSDSAIEAWVEWNGEPGKLIAALVQSGWLDRHVEHRLIVHDWHNHADSTTRKYLGRTKRPFLTMSETCPVHVPDKSETCQPITEFAPDLQVSGAGSRKQVSEPEPGAARNGAKAPPDLKPEVPADEIPGGLDPLQYARGLLQKCNIPHALATQRAASSAIEAYAKEHSVPLHRATATLIELARGALARGETVSKFWFEDGKYRNMSAVRASPVASLGQNPNPTEWDDAAEVEAIRKSQAAGEKVNVTMAEFADRWERSQKYQKNLQDQITKGDLCPSQT